jgi:hypothetical protein
MHASYQTSAIADHPASYTAKRAPAQSLTDMHTLCTPPSAYTISKYYLQHLCCCVGKVD